MRRGARRWNPIRSLHMVRGVRHPRKRKLRVEYKGFWDISVSLTYYKVIYRRRIDIILSYQAGFLKKYPPIGPDEGSLI